MTVVLHAATALSTLLIFRDEVAQILRGLLQFKWNKEFQFSLKIILSMFPAALVGVLFDEQIDALFGGRVLLVGSMLIVTGLLLFVADKAKNTTQSTRRPRRATTRRRRAAARRPPPWRQPPLRRSRYCSRRPPPWRPRCSRLRLLRLPSPPRSMRRSPLRLQPLLLPWQRSPTCWYGCAIARVVVCARAPRCGRCARATTLVSELRADRCAITAPEQSQCRACGRRWRVKNCTRPLRSHPS